MEIIVKLTGEEILSKPNDSELGDYVRNKYWQERRNLEGPPLDDEHVILNVNENNVVESISSVKTYDKCVICGKESPYTINTHINLRVGYVEGGGQGCFTPQKCYPKNNF